MDTPPLPKAYRVVDPPPALTRCQGQVYQVIEHEAAIVHLQVDGLSRWFWYREVAPVVTCRRRGPTT